MDRAAFWELIAVVDRVALDRSDDAAAVQPLIHALAKHDDEAIAGFEEHLAQALYELDGREFAANAGESSDSDDGFLYARCFVVACGEQTWRSVVAAPERMPKSLEQWCEALLYVAQRAWASRTGRDEEDWSVQTSVSVESGSNTARWS